MNIVQVFHSGDAILMITFLILIIMSVISWAVIIRKAIDLKKEKQSIDNFNEKYKTPTEVMQSLQNVQNNAIGNIVSCASLTQSVVINLHANEAREILTMNLAQALDKEKIILDSGLTTLASIANSAPFIGLFGTVWGIYNALLEISSQGSAGLGVVAAPMGEALVATAVGLFVAIPASIAYNTFARKNKLLIQELRHISEKLTIYATIKCQ